MSSKKREYVLDIETRDWITPLCVCIRAVDDSTERYQWTGPRSVELAARHIARTGGTYHGHYAGHFDWLLVMDKLPTPSDVILAGGGILKAAWFKTHDNPQSITLRDTYPLLSASLAKLGAWVGLEKGDLPRDRLEEYPLATVAEYCMRDCDVLAAALQAQRTWAGSMGASPKNTSGAQAVALLATLEPASQAACMSAVLTHSQALRAQLEKWSRGARTEICYCGNADNVYCYDINSSYPARYSTGPLPLGVAYKGKPLDFAIAKCVWRRNSREVPAAVVGQGGIGSGWCEAWLTREELDWMHVVEGRNIAGLEIVDKIWPKTWARIGETFAKRLFASKQTGCPWSKLAINSLHGKFGERVRRTNYVQTQLIDGTWGDLEAKTIMTKGKRPGLAPWHIQPLASAYVMARARMALLNRALAVQNAGHHIFYMDTDSIFTDANPLQFEAAGGKIGTGLGEWKVERGPLPACFVAPKLYRHGQVKHAKGVNPAELDDATFSRLATGLLAKIPRQGLATWLETGWQGKKPRARTEHETRTLTRVLAYKELLPGGFLRYTEEVLQPVCIPADI